MRYADWRKPRALGFTGVSTQLSRGSASVDALRVDAIFAAQLLRTNGGRTEHRAGQDEKEKPSVS